MRIQFPLSAVYILTAISTFIPSLSQAAPATAVRKIVPKTPPSFTSKPHHFAVWFPVKPVQSKQVTPMPNGETLNTYIFKADTQPVTYVVIATPTTKSVNASDPVGQLDANQKGMLGASGATLQKRQELQLGQYRGREIKTTMMGGKATSRVRFFFTPQMFYQVMVVGLKEPMQKQNAQIDKVFDSFRILS